MEKNFVIGAINSHLQLISYLNLHIELSPMETKKNYFTIDTINCWNKAQNILKYQPHKSFYLSKIKIVLTKRCTGKN